VQRRQGWLATPTFVLEAVGADGQLAEES
jgi:hypothetical protein